MPDFGNGTYISTEGVEKVAFGTGKNYNIENDDIFNTFIQSLSK